MTHSAPEFALALDVFVNDLHVLLSYVAAFTYNTESHDYIMGTSGVFNPPDSTLLILFVLGSKLINPNYSHFLFCRSY